MPSVLVVDDEPDMRQLVVEVLRTRGDGSFEVVGCAADGYEGVSMWRSHRPDIVLLDHRMPGLTGIEVAEVVLGERPQQCVVLFSAFVTDELEERAAEIGVRICVGKDRVLELPQVFADVCGA